MAAKSKATASANTKMYVAHFATSGKLDVVETWLGRNAKSDWALRTEGASDDLSVKKYAVSFRDKNDYDAFRARFAPSS